MDCWKAHEAKARFSELVDEAISRGPQILTRHGAEVAVMASNEEWRRLRAGRPTLKEWLLAPEPRFETIVTTREVRHREIRFSNIAPRVSARSSKLVARTSRVK